MTLIEELQDLSNRYRSSYEELGDKDELVMANAIDDCIDIVKKHSDWVACSERLPKHDGEYMVYLIVDTDSPIKTMAFCGYMAETKQFVLECEGLEVTHWQPLPKTPSEVQP